MSNYGVNITTCQAYDLYLAFVPADCFYVARNLVRVLDFEVC